MNKLAGVVAGALVSLAASSAAFAQQASGVVGRGAPEDFTLEIAIGADGAMTLSQTEFRLAWGGYYRFNLICPSNVINESGLSWSAPDFLENAHIRIVSVSDVGAGFQDANEINFHLQGLNLRMVDCEGLNAAARISFHPMRRGTYDFTVLNDAVQPNVTMTGQFIVE